MAFDVARCGPFVVPGARASLHDWQKWHDRGMSRAVEQTVLRRWHDFVHHCGLPLWDISGHCPAFASCPLYPR
jgi:hypothetical protein